MNTKTLYVIGDQHTVTFFKLLGCLGSSIESGDQLHDSRLEIESQINQIGAILISQSLAQSNMRQYERISKLGVPILTLPDESTSNQFGNRLQLLMEKAIGMKMDQVNKPKESA